MRTHKVSGWCVRAPARREDAVIGRHRRTFESRSCDESSRRGAHPVGHGAVRVVGNCRWPVAREVAGLSECQQLTGGASRNQVGKSSGKMHALLRRRLPRAAGARAKTRCCRSRKRPTHGVGKSLPPTPRIRERNFGFMPLSCAARARELAARPTTATNRARCHSIYIGHGAVKRTPIHSVTARVPLPRTRTRRVTARVPLPRTRARRVTSGAEQAHALANSCRVASYGNHTASPGMAGFRHSE